MAPVPETTEKPRYVSYPVEPDLFDGLGLDPDGAGVREIRGALQGLHGIAKAAKPLGIGEPIQIAAALARYKAALDAERRRLAKMFSRAEWNVMADVCNGTLDLMDYSEAPTSFRVMLLGNVGDSQWPDGDESPARGHLGASWFPESPDGGDMEVRGLLRKLAGLSPIEADAIVTAIREFWSNPGADHQVDEWWLPKGPRRKGNL